MQIVTANRLVDGRVVFRDAAGGWSETLAAADVLETAGAALAAAEADVAAARVVGVYAVDVEIADGVPVPKAIRERIRIAGPTSGSESRADHRPIA